MTDKSHMIDLNKKTARRKSWREEVVAGLKR